MTGRYSSAMPYSRQTNEEYEKKLENEDQKLEVDTTNRDFLSKYKYGSGVATTSNISKTPNKFTMGEKSKYAENQIEDNFSNNEQERRKDIDYEQFKYTNSNNQPNASSYLNKFSTPTPYNHMNREMIINQNIEKTENQSLNDKSERAERPDKTETQTMDYNFKRYIVTGKQIGRAHV